MGHIVTVNVDGCEVRRIVFELSEAAWDQRLQAGLQDMGAAIAAAVLQGEDQQLRAQVPAEWENVGREQRQLATLVGQVVVKRRVYRDGQGVRHKPLDEVLGLPPYVHETPGFRRLAAYLASGQTYRRAAEHLSGQVGWRVNCMRILRAAWAVGQGLVARQQAARAAVFERGVEPQEGQIEAPLLFAEADGVWLSLQREAKAKAEVRVAVFYTGKERLGKGRRQLKDKLGFSALVADSQEWQELLLLTAFSHYRLSGTQQLVLNGDGAEWVRHSLDRFALPVCYQLDRYHLFQAARAAAPGVSELMAQACQDGLAAVEPQLRSLIAQAEGGERERLLAFYDYVKHNQDGLIDYRLRLGLGQADQPGLGAIEGNVDKLVVQRLKGRGMSWRLQGAVAMLALCRHRSQLRDAALPIAAPPAAPAKPSANRPLDTAQAHDEAYGRQASLPILHSSAENTPLGRTLRGIVNGDQDLAL